MKELITRTLTGLVFVIVTLGCTFWNHYAFALLFLVAAMLGLNEFYRIISLTGNIKPHKLFGFIAGGIAYISVALVSMGLLDPFYLLFNLIFMIIPLIVELKLKNKDPFGNAAATIFGLLYVLAPFAVFNIIINPTLQTGKYFPGIMIGIFILVWAYDTFAYLIGTIIGKHKLSQDISPKKTWEGSIGSAIISLVLAWLVSWYIPEFTFYEWMIIALIIISFGTLGDIVESMLKRSAGIKDSANLLPGHGGILDRFDGLLFSAPVLMIYIILVT